MGAQGWARGGLSLGGIRETGVRARPRGPHSVPEVFVCRRRRTWASEFCEWSLGTPWDLFFIFIRDFYVKLHAENDTAIEYIGASMLYC
jgi:hypothetical protein